MDKEGPSNKLQQVSETKRELVQQAELGLTVSKRLSLSKVALMFGISTGILEKCALSVSPREEGAEVTIGSDADKHLDNLSQWLREDETQSQKLLEERYKFLFSAGQASVNPSVDFQNIIESKSSKMKIMERVFPEIKKIREHHDQGGKIQDLIREDREYFAGKAYASFDELSKATQEILKNRGLNPENMFQTPDE